MLRGKITAEDKKGRENDGRKNSVEQEENFCELKKRDGRLAAAEERNGQQLEGSPYKLQVACFGSLSYGIIYVLSSRWLFLFTHKKEGKKTKQNKDRLRLEKEYKKS